MSRTYKRLARGQFRTPRGNKRAKIANCRPGAIPPHSWDDVNYCNLAFRPWKIARNMLAENIIQSVAIIKLQKKCRITFKEARGIVKVTYKHYKKWD